MWLAEIVYHIAFRYKRPHASLLNAKATRQSHGWTYRKASRRCTGIVPPTVQAGGGLRRTTDTLLGRVDLFFMPELNSTAPVI